MIDFEATILELKKNLDPTLVQQLVAEFIALEKSYSLMRWKYSELDGGRFCEVVARIVYSVDSKNINRSKTVDDCLRYIENNKIPHNFPEPRSVLHIARVLRATYKLRSQRGAVHVSPVYTADEIDSKLIVENCRWLMVEILRMFSDEDKEKAVEVIKEISRFEHPVVRVFDSKKLVQSTSFSAQEEVLLLLHNSEPETMSVDELVKSIPKHSSGVRKAIKILESGRVRQIIKIDQDYKITDLGLNRVEELLTKAN